MKAMNPFPLNAVFILCPNKDQLDIIQPIHLIKSLFNQVLFFSQLNLDAFVNFKTVEQVKME